MEQASLVEVDVADVTVLVDTFVDILMAGTEVAHRAPLAYEWSEGDQLRAEHGFALLPTVQRDGQTQSILYDAGLGRDTAVYNMDVLEIRPTDLRAIVLSHGHADHHAGLEGVLRRLDDRACRWFCTPTPGEIGASRSHRHRAPHAPAESSRPRRRGRRDR